MENRMLHWEADSQCQLRILNVFFILLLRIYLCYLHIGYVVKISAFEY